MKKNIKSGATEYLKNLVAMLVLVMMVLPASLPRAATAQQMTAEDSLQALLASLRGQALTEREQVARVNAFFNRIPRSHDSATWGRKDYWATPTELLQRRRGDCEDVAIAKYFTLRKLGVPDHRLRLAYGKIIDMQRGVIEPHMVLIYKPDNTPEQVLDSMDGSLRKLSERQNLVLEYTFNTDSVWLWQSDSPVLLGKASTLEPWRNLLERL